MSVVTPQQNTIKFFEGKIIELQAELSLYTSGKMKLSRKSDKGIFEDITNDNVEQIQTEITEYQRVISGIKKLG